MEISRPACGDQKTKLRASAHAPNPCGVSIDAAKARVPARIAILRGNRVKHSAVAAAITRSAPGDIHTASHEVSASVATTSRSVRFTVAVLHNESKSTANPNPLHPLAGPENTTASNPGTSGPKPRHDLSGKERNQLTTANHATRMWAFCHPRGPAAAKTAAVGAPLAVSGCQTDGPDTSHAPANSADDVLIGSGPRSATSAPSTSRDETTTAASRRQLFCPVVWFTRTA